MIETFGVSRSFFICLRLREAFKTSQAQYLRHMRRVSTGIVEQ